MSKHTPGPWVASEMMANRRITIKGGLSSVAVVSVGNVDHLANARLIAAAPELLEAAKEMLQLLESIRNLNGPPIDKARAAIAKAGGNDE